MSAFEPYADYNIKFVKVKHMFFISFDRKLGVHCVHAENTIQLFFVVYTENSVLFYE